MKKVIIIIERSKDQFSSYAENVEKPHPLQKKKIETALHRLGSELLAVEL